MKVYNSSFGVAGPVAGHHRFFFMWRTWKPHRHCHWLAKQLGQGRIEEAAPIGFYFAKLWYFERLYPLIFATSALRRVSYFNANAAVKAEFDA